MPGYHFIFNRTHSVAENKQKYENALSDSLLFTYHTHRIVFSDSSYFLGETAYEQYPLRQFENDDYSVYIEGFMYAPPIREFLSELYGILGPLFRDSHQSTENLTAFLRSVDGDFNVIAFQKSSNKSIIFNDLLGHLPLYYTTSDEYLAVSRENSFIHRIIGNCHPDRRGIAQYLLFSYALGARTLVQNVHKMLPGSMIIIHPRKNEIVFRQFHQFNYEEQSSHAINTNVNDLMDIWHVVMKRRAAAFENQKNILALSGGLDSRSVAAGLFKNEIPFTPLSFVTNDGSSSKDMQVARTIASIMKTSLHVETLPTPTGNDALLLLQMKYGLNYLGMSFIIAFFNLIRNSYGSGVMYFSGDTGMTMRDYRPVVRLRNDNDILKYMFRYGGRFSSFALLSLAEVTAITGVKQDDIYQDVLDEFTSYPEQQYDMKYVHFTFNGYCFKMHYEGIDRIRSFFWPAVPFESLPFFTRAMQCASEQKKNYRLFREFICTMFPETASLVNVNWNLPVDSKLLNLKFNIRNAFLQLPSAIRMALNNPQRNSPPYAEKSELYTIIRNQMDKTPAIGDYISVQNLSGALHSFNRPQLNVVFTALSLVEFLQAKKSVLETYSEKAIY